MLNLQISIYGSKFPFQNTNSIKSYGYGMWINSWLWSNQSKLIFLYSFLLLLHFSQNTMTWFRKDETGLYNFVNCSSINIGIILTKYNHRLHFHFSTPLTHFWVYYLCDAHKIWIASYVALGNCHIAIVRVRCTWHRLSTNVPFSEREILK